MTLAGGVGRVKTTLIRHFRFRNEKVGGSLLNYENLIQRLLDGLNLIRTHTGGAIEIAAHSYTIMVPDVTYGVFSDDEVKDMIEWGWRWNDDGSFWVLPVLG